MAISADSARRNCVISRKSTHVVHISSDHKYSIENVRLRPLTFLCYAAKETRLTCQRSSSSQRYDNSLRNGHSAHKNAQLPSRKKNKSTAERTLAVYSERVARESNMSFLDSALCSSIPCVPSVQRFRKLRSTLYPPRRVIVIKGHASSPMARKRLDCGDSDRGDSRENRWLKAGDVTGKSCALSGLTDISENSDIYGEFFKTLVSSLERFAAKFASLSRSFSPINPLACVFSNSEASMSS
jgi:hypothetical protein